MSNPTITRHDTGCGTFSEALDGWLNVTELALTRGKDAAGWFEQRNTQEYIHMVGTRTGEALTRKQGDHIWIHDALRIHFVHWLEPDFALWCDELVCKHGGAK